MKRTIAVFDIDGTLLKDTSAERIFVKFLLFRGELSLFNGANFIIHFLETFPRNWIMATKGNRFYLKGREANRFDELAEECFRTRIVPRISKVAREKIEEHRSDGLEVVLLSGTPQLLLRHFQAYLGAEHAHGSTLKISDGRYTGHIDGVYPYGRVKVEIVWDYYGGGSYDLSASYAYADHISDFEFLQLFGHPTLVNPTSRLAAKAKEMGFDTALF